MPKDSDEFKKAFGLSATSTFKTVEKAVFKQYELLKQSLTLLQKVGSPDYAQAKAAADALLQGFIDAKQESLVREREATRTLKKDVGPPMLDLLKQNRLAAKQTPLTVQAGNPAAPVKVFWTDIPGFEDMDDNARAAAAQKVAEKVARGSALVTNIQNGQAPNGLNRGQKREAVTDIVWAMKAKAQEKVGAYEKGGLTVPGGEELRQFFDSCGDDIYPRRSTHLGDQQRQPGQSPRGMDFYDGADTLANGTGEGLLPCGMNTLLMQQVTDTNGNKRMYIKMETESAFGSAGDKNKNDPQGIPNGGRTEKGSMGDLISHGMNIFRNTDMHNDLPPFREDTPDGLYKPCKLVVKACTDKAGKAALALLLGKDEHKLRVNKFMAELAKWQANSGGFTSDDARDAIADLKDKLEEVYAGHYGQNADMSIHAGGEVALTLNDL